MGFLKKPAFWVITVAVIVCVCVVGFFVLRDREATLIYKIYGISIEDTLTEEETERFRKILWGKRSYSGFLEGIPSCGFAEDVAIVLDGERYHVACDLCGTLMVNGRYIDVSSDEAKLIYELFEKRGGKFPCN